MSTTTATILGALIALGGVLLTVAATATSTALQRRHERQLRLDEARRAAYSQMIVTLRTMSELERSVPRIESQIAEMKALVENAGFPLNEAVLGFGLDEVERVASRLVEQNARLDALHHGLAELNATVGLLGSDQVVDALAAVVQRVTSGSTEPNVLNLSALIAACRIDLGVPDK